MGKAMVGVMFVLFVCVASGAEGDVGVVNQVNGDVRYTPLSGAPGAVKPFMRLRGGDQVTIAGGGGVRLVYFGSARQERWTGPASFRAASGASEIVSGDAPKVTVLPAGAIPQIASVPRLMAIASLGGMRVRGAREAPPQAGKSEAELTEDQQARIRDARNTHDKLRDALPPDDVTAELYLVAALNEYKLYREMKAVVEEMLRKQPENRDLRNLQQWVNNHIGP